MRFHRAVVTYAVASVLSLHLPVLAAPPVPCSDPRGCPDLVVDPTTMAPYLEARTIAPDDCQVVEGMTKPGTRTLLRFGLTTPNVGTGALVIGRPADHPEWFHFSPCHGHYHFNEYADYRLWTPKQHARWESYRRSHPDLTAAQALAARPDLRPAYGNKAGFCAMDVRQYDPAAPPLFLSCEFQGISAGWADDYGPGLDGQYVDVTGLSAGTYVLEAEVDAERLFVESDHTNNRGALTVTIP